MSDSLRFAIGHNIELSTVFGLRSSGNSAYLDVRVPNPHARVAKVSFHPTDWRYAFTENAAADRRAQMGFSGRLIHRWDPPAPIHEGVRRMLTITVPESDLREAASPASRAKRLLPPPPVGSLGRFSLFEVEQGAALAPLQSAEHVGDVFVDADATTGHPPRAVCVFYEIVRRDHAWNAAEQTFRRRNAEMVGWSRTARVTYFMPHADPPGFADLVVVP